jgi:hypothetical protein
MSVRIQLRRDTAANWTSTNPTLAQGEPGYETDTGKIKYGDGSTAWSTLAYAPASNILDGLIVDSDINTSAAINKVKISGTAITAADTGTVTNTMLAGSIAPSKISGTAVVDTDERLSDARTPTDGSVTTAKIVDGAVTPVKLDRSYAPSASPTFTGTVTIPAGASIDGYLTSAAAASTYQTQAGMSNYLPTSSVGTSVQPYNANTALLNVAQTFSALQTFNSGASDSSGSFRVVPANSQASAYTPISSDTGKYISISSGGVTVPASIFNSGAVFSIYNNSGSPQTITQGSGVTLRQAGTTNTGNRSLAAYGIATVLCVGSGVFVISGVGLS